MKSEVDARRIFLLFAACAIAGAIAWLGQPLLDSSEKAIDLIVNTFSILAGFLVAIIAIVGDPGLLPAGGWRAAELNRLNIKRRLTRYKWLFLLYLGTLALVFVSLLLKPLWPCAVAWIQRAYLFFGSLAFGFSLRLPSALIAAQQEKIDALIEERRTAEGIPESKQDGPPKV